MSRADAIHALLHPTFSDVLQGEPGGEGQVRLFIGHPHAHALPDDEIEVLVHEFPGTGREAIIFHLMRLGPKYRRYREEHS